MKGKNTAVKGYGLAKTEKQRRAPASRSHNLVPQTRSSGGDAALSLIRRDPYSGENFTSTNSRDSRGAVSHFQARTVLTAACASTGWPPLICTSFTVPSGAT